MRAAVDGNPDMIEPTPYIAPLPSAPEGNWLKRAFVALAIERRLPYQVSIVLDRLSNAIGLRRKTVLVNGFRIRVRRLTCDENFVTNIISKSDYTPHGFEINDTDTVIDIGGNIGTFAVVAARSASRGRVISVEPNAENYALLLENLALNQIDNVVPVHAALAARKGQVKLFTAKQGGFHSLIDDRAPDLEQYEVVECMGLKDVFDEHRIERCNFMKLDCEGAEYEILYNLPAEYFSRIDKISMEYHGDPDESKRRIKADALVSYLETMGFRIDAYIDFTNFDCGMIRATRARSKP